MEGDYHGYSYATSLAAITDEIQNNVEDIQKEVQNKAQKPATIKRVYMGERVSGRAPSSVPTVDKVMTKVGSAGAARGCWRAYNTGSVHFIPIVRELTTGNSSP